MSELNRFNKERAPGKIVPGYSSIFDKMTSSFGQQEQVKEEFENAVKKVHDAWTLLDLYNGVRSMIYDLEDTQDEQEIKKILFKVWNAVDKIDSKSTTTATETAYTTLSNLVIQRFTSIITKAQ
jgi:DNA replication initiation complex subunit (GINS family)